MAASREIGVNESGMSEMPGIRMMFQPFGAM